MIEKAKLIEKDKRLPSGPSRGITFLRHAAEDLDFLETGSVDLVVSGKPPVLVY